VPISSAPYRFIRHTSFGWSTEGVDAMKEC
jgi:hypothetical protein